MSLGDLESLSEQEILDLYEDTGDFTAASGILCFCSNQCNLLGGYHCMKYRSTDYCGACTNCSSTTGLTINNQYKCR